MKQVAGEFTDLQGKLTMYGYATSLTPWFVLVLVSTRNNRLGNPDFMQGNMHYVRAAAIDTQPSPPSNH